MRFSIITPYYKCFDLMRNYFDSLERQTYKDFEVILIDDASQDNAINNIKAEFEKRGIQYTIKINKTNCGPGVARNIGIENACGEYILFLDADDWFANDTLAILNETAIQMPEVECMAFDYFSVTGGNEKKHSILTCVQKCKLTYRINTSTWGKAYKRGFILDNHVQFYPGFLAEDFYFTIAAINKCNSFYHIEKNLYYYRMNENSITHTINLKWLSTIRLILEELFDKGYIDIEENNFFVLREYVYTIIRTEKGKRNKDVDIYLRQYRLGEILKYAKYLRTYQAAILILYKLRLNKLIDIGLRICK